MLVATLSYSSGFLAIGKYDDTPRIQVFSLKASRRDYITGVSGALSSILVAASASATEGGLASPLEMQVFEDPLFSVRVPKTFFTLRRTQKGDLPDAKTGKGRRGSSIFTAGNMAKAEVIAVEVCEISIFTRHFHFFPTSCHLIPLS